MTPPRALVIVGGGEHARVLIEAARSRPDLWSIRGFLDPTASAETTGRLGVPRLGDDDAAGGHGDALFVLGIGGSAELRRAAVARYEAQGVQWAIVVHSSAAVSPTSTLGPGSVVFANAVVNTGAILGEHCIANSGAIIEHDVRLGAFTHAAPGTVVGGGARVGQDVHLGLGSRIRDHVVLGARVTVGMGAVVVSNVADGATVVGVPALVVAVQP